MFLQALGEAFLGPELVTSMSAVTAIVVPLEEFGVLLGHTAALRHKVSRCPWCHGFANHQPLPRRGTGGSTAARTNQGFSLHHHGARGAPLVLTGQESWQPLLSMEGQILRAEEHFCLRECDLD